jgi:hypothetical protein
MLEPFTAVEATSPRPKPRAATNNRRTHSAEDVADIVDIHFPSDGLAAKVTLLLKEIGFTHG